MTADPAVRELTRRLARLEDLFRQQSAPGLAHSSMEGGSIPVYQPGTAGTTVGVELGTQYDGNYGAAPLVGAIPPVPTAPTFRIAGNVAFVAWDGHFADSPFTVAPSDWKETEIHIGDSPAAPDFGVSAATMARPSFTSARGGEIGIGGLQSGVDYYACLTARTVPGKFSAPSTIIGPIRIGQIPSVQLDASSLSYLGGVDPTNALVSSTDETGRSSVQDLVVQADPTFQGRRFSARLMDMPGGGDSGSGAVTGNYFASGFAAGVEGAASEIGLIEFQAVFAPNRLYRITPMFYWRRSTTNTYCEIRLRDGGSAAPTVASPVLQEWFAFGADNNPSYSTPTAVPRTINTDVTSGWIGSKRLLLTVNPGGGGTVSVDNNSFGQSPQVLIEDLGPSRSSGAVLNRGGGGGAPPPPPTQQYYVDLGWQGRYSYRGNSTLRTDTTDVVQGYDPSGFNGDGYGYYGFGNLPSITGTVDRVDLYLYFNSWYYNSGGSPIINLIRAGDPSTVAGFNSLKLIGLVGSGWPKPGGIWFTVPTTWLQYFHNNAGANRFVGVALGPAGGTNLIYYGRSSDCRVRVWYTQ